MNRCADCGAKVTGGRRQNGWWVTKPGGGGATSTCRIEWSDDGRTILSADYHYVEGEEQRHFRRASELDDDSSLS